jgi:hypothetical protein
MPRRRNDQKMREVKAFLQRLQRLDEESLSLTGVATAIARHEVEPRSFRALSSVRSPKFPIGLVLIAASALAFFAGDLGFKNWLVKSDGILPRNAEASLAISSSSADVVSEARGEMSATAAVGNAQRLMDAGQIIAARRLLLRPDVAVTQDGAWRLARSYDPNYLAGVPSPDASSDKAEAAEWYSRWRDIGAANGMTMDDLHLRRIINSMG